MTALEKKNTSFSFRFIFEAKDLIITLDYIIPQVNSEDTYKCPISP